jgi:hypothetical protein
MHMASPGDRYFNPVTGTKLVFTATATSSRGTELAIDWFVPPGERLTAMPHCHAGPDGFLIEHFDLVAGSAACRIGGVRHQAEAPHIFSIPAHTPHVHPWNIGPVPLHVRQRITPPHPDVEVLAGVERFFETLTALSQQRKANRRGDILNPLQAALLLTSTVFPITYVAYVPLRLQMPLLKGLAELGGRLGYPAHLMPNPATEAAPTTRQPEPTS